MLACAPLWACTLACSAPNRFPGTVDGQGLDHVHELAAAVVSPPRVALSVLVVHQLGLGFQHRLAGVVFRCDQDDGVALTAVLILNGGGDGGVYAVEYGGHIWWLLLWVIFGMRNYMITNRRNKPVPFQYL